MVGSLGAKNTRHVSGACAAGGDAPPRATRPKKHLWQHKRICV
jgi:hypothetical protein